VKSKHFTKNDYISASLLRRDDVEHLKKNLKSIIMTLYCAGVSIECLLANASAMILAHNHPSGTLKPSDTDIKLTRKLKSAGEILDIAVYDHMILTREGYYSFADKGII